MKKVEIDSSYLFKDKKIWQDESSKKYHGQFPIIFLSFKDIKANNWQDAYEHLTLIISREFSRHSKAIDTSINSYDRVGGGR